MKWFFKCFKHYADFSGRARRREYWWFVLINFIIGILLMIGYFPQYLNIMMEPSEDPMESMQQMFTLYTNPFYIISLVYSLAILIPNLAVWTRRLHDIGRSGWWIVIFFVLAFVFAILAGIGAGLDKAWLICIAGILVLAICIINIVWLFLDSKPQNKWGPNPKEADAIEKSVQNQPEQ